MPTQNRKRYWKSREERDGAPDPAATDREFFDTPAVTGAAYTTRRGFLTAAGFGLAGAALSSCSRAPVVQAIPYLVQPEEVTPGRPYFYASTCGGCSAGCGLIVRNRDGRPVKLEGNPDHPASRGGLCAAGQASILGLYDSQRLTAPMRDGQRASWADVDGAIRTTLDDIRTQGGAVRFLTGTVTSPTVRSLIGAFLKPFPNARHVAYDALSTSALLDACEQTHGARVLPRLRFDRAEVIVSFDADFLGTWISPVEYTVGYSAGRTLRGDPPRLSYHAQFESRMSLTGGRADWRIALAPAEIGIVIGHLAERLARMADMPLAPGALPPAPVPAARLDELADRLWRARGRSLVVCASQDTSLQVLCNAMNHAVGAYGTTIDVERPSYQRAGNDRDLEALRDELSAGGVAALFIAGVNPVYDLPDGDGLAQALRTVPLVISFADHVDETSSVARYVCPDRHFLECWSDTEAVAGVVSLTQPVIRPLGESRQLIESLAVWSGAPMSACDLVRAHWTQQIYPRRRTDAPFRDFWERAVHDGVVEVTPDAPAVRPFGEAARGVMVPEAPPLPDGDFALVLYPTVGMLDGRHAHNPWLHELPDPTTKVTWDNYASFSPEAAGRIGIADGDVVRLESSDGLTGATKVIELSAHLQPGQHDRVVAVALGYGRMGTDRFAKVGPQWIEGRTTVGTNGLIGVSAAGFRTLANGVLRDTGRLVRVTKTGRTRPLAATQSHHMIAVPAALAPAGGARRPIVEETTLAAYVKDPTAGSLGHAEPTADLWPPDHPYTGHRWAMVVDLNACTGCAACVIGCQVENNVPVVGRDEVRRHREMHWIRIDRYYADGDDGGVDVIHQPMLCQHCEHASCEVVCPVLATVHSSEGLNQQIYNRCVGTRYCANNCPYKVRRFNWFDYPREDRLQNLVLNPDVVVRSRGVMEKCSMCIQRIQNARIEAARLGQPLGPNAVETACQQSCPARAITFGDANDPESPVSQARTSPRYFRVLAELNVKPAVGYLRLVRHRPEDGGERRHG